MDEEGGVAEDLMLLVAVIEAGGFSAASQRVGIPVSRLSRRIAALEKRLNVRLIARSSRSFKVTDIGQRMYEHGVSIRAATQRAVSAAHDSLGEPSGPLRISCPMALSAFLVGPLAIGFSARHPAVAITLDATDGRASVFSEPVDLWIRPSDQSLRDSSWVMRKLMDVPYMLAASPRVRDALPDAATAAGLRGCPAIGWTFKPRPAAWLLRHARDGELEIDVRVQFTSDSLMQIKEAAIAGLGVAQLPAMMCVADLEAHRLVAVAPGWAPPLMSLYALYPSRRDLTIAGRMFLDELCKAAAGIAGPPAPPQASHS
ncbi:LysR family transcriptional regulator (plasmid) [Variovorax sp. V59]|uniref:LysR substrate-binding domain-containing protein n=1 Tax=unclassified Variovorax TaxID=663243 RepID=UPI0034E89E68